MKNISLRFVYPKGSMQNMVMRLLSIMSVYTEDSISGIEGFDLGNGVSIWEIDRFRSQDIPDLLERGVFDMGIVGRDWIVERDADIIELTAFSLSRETFNPIRIVLAAPQELGCKSIQDLPLGAVIATEYPITARKYLDGYGRQDISISLSYGDTERKVGIGAATAIIDITETGRTLKANGLEIIQVLCESTMTLSANLASYRNEKKRSAILKFAGMVNDCYRLMLLDNSRGVKI